MFVNVIYSVGMDRRPVKVVSRLVPEISWDRLHLSCDLQWISSKEKITDWLTDWLMVY